MEGSARTGTAEECNVSTAKSVTSTFGKWTYSTMREGCESMIRKGKSGVRVTAAVVGNMRSAIDDLDRLRDPHVASDMDKKSTEWRAMRLGLGGRGAGRNLRIVFDLGSNSVMQYSLDMDSRP